MKSSLIQIFARLPIPGLVKTRLISAIGQDKAASLALEMLKRTIGCAKKVKIADVEYWYTGCDNLSDFPIDAISRHQFGSDLGERMMLALTDGTRRSKSVVLAGTDCPTIDDRNIAAALRQLESHRVVIARAMTTR